MSCRSVSPGVDVEDVLKVESLHEQAHLQCNNLRSIPYCNTGCLLYQAGKVCACVV